MYSTQAIGKYKVISGQKMDQLRHFISYVEYGVVQCIITMECNTSCVKFYYKYTACGYSDDLAYVLYD